MQPDVSCGVALELLCAVSTVCPTWWVQQKLLLIKLCTRAPDVGCLTQLIGTAQTG